MNELIGINQRAKDYEYIYINQKSYLKHRYIWEKNNGKIPEEHFIHHKNGNKKDNRIENLECLSRKEHGQKHLKPDRKRIIFKSGTIKVIRLTE